MAVIAVLIIMIDVFCRIGHSRHDRCTLATDKSKFHRSVRFKRKWPTRRGRPETGGSAPDVVG